MVLIYSGPIYLPLLSLLSLFLSFFQDGYSSITGCGVGLLRLGPHRRSYLAVQSLYSPKNARVSVWHAPPPPPALLCQPLQQETPPRQQQQTVESIGCSLSAPLSTVYLEIQEIQAGQYSTPTCKENADGIKWNRSLL